MYVGYPMGEKIVFQERFVQAGDLPEDFDPERPGRLAGARILESTEGGPLLEWTVTPAELSTFLGHR